MRKFRVRISAEKKKHLISFSIFFGIVFALTAALVTVTLLSRGAWRTGLAGEMQRVLDAGHPAQYTVGEFLPVESAVSTLAAVYSLSRMDARMSDRYYGVIVRIPSILGPLPAVFVYSASGGVYFAGYAVDNGKAGRTVDIRIESNVMRYWEDMIPRIVARARA